VTGSPDSIGERAATRSDSELHQEAKRIEQLLEDVKAIAGGPAWQRVEELVQRLVRLYGAGLERLMDHLARSGRLDEALAARLASDELLASLLLLHGLHPWSTAERVRRALELAWPELRAQVGELAVVAVEGDLVRLRLERQPLGPGAADLPVERIVHRALADSAPEIVRVEIEGLPRRAGVKDGGLVQIDLRRARGTPEEAPP
jgi:hypothetical protein